MGLGTVHPLESLVLRATWSDCHGSQEVDMQANFQGKAEGCAGGLDVGGEGTGL